MTALQSYEGIHKQNDLKFEHGDVLKVLSLVSEDPGWVYASLKDKEGYIPKQLVKPIK